MKTVDGEACGLFRVTGTLCLERDAAVDFLNIILQCCQNHK